MREIKFRAWAAAEDKMYYADKSSKFTIDFYGGVIYNRDTWADDLTLMQYTGLKDKNGVDIYEMDVLKVDWGGIQDEYILGNKYDKPFVIEWRGYEYPPFSRYLPTPDCVEILGNVYQNPELINQPEL